MAPPKVTVFARVSERVRFLPAALLMVLPKAIAPLPAVALKLFTKETGPVKLMPPAKARMMISTPVPTMMAEPLVEFTTKVVPAKISPAKVRVPPWVKSIVFAEAVSAPTLKLPWSVLRTIDPMVALTPATEILLVPAVSNLRLLE